VKEEGKIEINDNKRATEEDDDEFDDFAEPVSG
jgi:hypothetical protein